MVVYADSARKTMQCSCCGYGVAVLFEPAACPMCQASSWIETTAPAGPSFRVPRLPRRP